MEERSLDLIFLLGATRPFVILVREGLFIFQKMQLDFLRKSESTIESVFKIVIRPYTLV